MRGLQDKYLEIYSWQSYIQLLYLYSSHIYKSYIHNPFFRTLASHVYFRILLVLEGSSGACTIYYIHTSVAGGVQSNTKNFTAKLLSNLTESLTRTINNL